MISTRRLLAPLLGLALIGSGWAASVAGAQEDEGRADRLVLRGVDSRDADAVSIATSWSGDADALDDVKLEVGGEEVEVTQGTVAEVGWRNDVVFVVDTSASTDANGMLTMTQQAIEEHLASLPADARAAVIMAGALPQVLQGLTTDRALVLDAVGELTPTGEGGVFRSISTAAGRLDDETTVGTVVLFTDGTPEESTTAATVRGTLMEFGSMLQVIALDADGFNAAELTNLAERSGGTMQVTDDPERFPALTEPVITEIAQTFMTSFAADESEGVQDIEMVVGDTSVLGSYIAGGLQTGADSLDRLEPVEPAGPSFLRTGLGKTLGFVGVLVAAILFVFGLVSAFVKEDTGLSRVLRPYSDGYTAPGDVADEEGSGLAQTAFLKRAVEVTESFAQDRGMLDRVERMLERADMPLRAGEALFFYVAGGLVLLVLAFVLTSNLLGALVIGLIGFLVPPAIVSFMAARKQRQFEGLLPDTLQLLSSTLRAGYSMMQGVEAVSQEAAEPMGKELRRVVTEARLGRPLEEALDGVADRMDSPDFGWAVMAIRIQREVGGNLAELLMTVADTMTQRERLRRDVKSLTAEGRMSAYVLGGLPIGLGLVLYSMNPDYIGRLFDHTLGQIMLGGSIIAMIVGFAWMFKIIKIEI